MGKKLAVAAAGNWARGLSCRGEGTARVEELPSWAVARWRRGTAVENGASDRLGSERKETAGTRRRVTGLIPFG